MSVGAASLPGMTTELSFERLTELIKLGHAEALADALIALDEPARRALGARLPEASALGWADLGAVDWQVRWRLSQRRDAALRVAGAGCLTPAAKVVSWLREFGAGDDPALIGAVVRVLRAPGRPSIAAVARGLATRLRVNQVDQQWALVRRLLDVAGEPVPPTEATVRGWLRETGSSAEGLRADSRTRELLPHVFSTPRVGADVSPGGLANLTEHRAVILPGCVARLAEGDRPGSIRAFVELHRLLAPTADEGEPHRQTYLSMLDSPHSTVAEIALRALRPVDDPELVADAALSVLPRREKKLVRAQLDWASAVLAAKPDPALFEALLTGLANEQVDLAERTVRVIAKHLPALGADGVALLAAAAEGLSGDLRRQVTALLPAASVVSPASPASAVSVLEAPVIGGPIAAAAMPPPLGSIPEVVAATAAIMLDDAPDPVRLEEVLDGLVRFAHRDRAGLAVALAPKLTHWDSPFSLMTKAVVGGTWRPWVPNRWEAEAPPPFWLLVERLGEIGRQMTRAVPPALLATPATVDGHVSPARVLELLTAAERDGWQPGRFDLTQALLRLPRAVDPAVLTGAARLTSPAGRLFAGWLAGGGLPDPLIVTGEAVWHGCPDPDACTCQWPHRVRWTSSFDAVPLPVPAVTVARPSPAPPYTPVADFGTPAPPLPDGRHWPTVPPTPNHLGPAASAPLSPPTSPPAASPASPSASSLPGPGASPLATTPAEPTAAGLAELSAMALAVPVGLLDLPADPDRFRGRRPSHRVTHWPAILPGHPEIVAAHALPEILQAVDGDDRSRLAVLPVLAASSGPFGPALALCVALGFSADQAPGRVFATDAFIDLATRGKLDAALIGRELANLQRDGRMAPKRVAGCLTEAMRAGLSAEVWSTVRELLPAALSRPVPGTPDLLAAAESAAAAVRATDHIAGLAEVAARPGRNRLVTEAARLTRTLTDNKPPGTP